MYRKVYLFVLEDLHNFGPDYDKTLMTWYHNFENGWSPIRKEVRRKIQTVVGIISSKLRGSVPLREDTTLAIRIFKRRQ